MTLPDLTTFAKAVNNATVPLGGVIVRDDLYQAFMTGPAHSIEFFHESGLDYVSCSPFRVPIARIAAARAQIANPRRDMSVFERL